MRDNTSKTGVDQGDIELAAHVLDAAEVALAPGSAFGFPGHLRLSFATDVATTAMLGA